MSIRRVLALALALTAAVSAYAQDGAPTAPTGAAPAPGAPVPLTPTPPDTPAAPSAPPARTEATRPAAAQPPDEPGGSASDTAAGAIGIPAPDAADADGAGRPAFDALGLSEAAAEPAGAPAATPADVRTLTVAVLADAAPFSSAGRFGVRTGFDVDIAKALCDALPARCTLLPLPPDDIDAALADRRADLALAAIELGGRREGNVVLSTPYVRLAIRSVTPVTPTKSAPEALDVVGVLAGTAQADYAASANPPLGAVRPYPDNEDMWLDLALGRLDVVLAPAVTAQQEFLSTPLGRGFRLRPQEAADSEALARPAAVALRAGEGELRAAVDRAIAAVVASPEYGELLERYLGGLASPPARPGG